MNRADVALVDQQLNQLGQTLLQQQQLRQTGAYQQAELRYRQLAEQAAVNRYEAQQQHWNTIESAGERNEKTREQNAAAQLDLEKQRLTQAGSAQQDQVNARDLQNKQGLLQSVIALNSTGQLDDDARDSVNDWLSNDEHFGATGIQLSKPDPSLAKTQQADAAVVNTLKFAAQQRALARTEGDPDLKKEYLNYADLAEKSVPAATAAARAAGTETDYTRDPNTGQLKRVVKQPLPGAGGAAGVGPAMPSWPAAPADPAHRVPGQRYMSPAGMSATWTGQGWDTSAPTIQVPGMGPAQEPPVQ